MPTVTVLTTALGQPSSNPAFHKTIVSSLLPHTRDLATSQYGHNYINAIVEIPSKGKERNVQFHVKEAIMGKLGENESLLRDSWMGRSVWRTWKGDLWKTRRFDWKAWMKELDAGMEPTSLERAMATKHANLKAAGESKTVERRVKAEADEEVADEEDEGEKKGNDEKESKPKKTKEEKEAKKKRKQEKREKREKKEKQDVEMTED
jgi:nucleolar protein 9